MPSPTPRALCVLLPALDVKSGPPRPTTRTNMADAQTISEAVSARLPFLLPTLAALLAVFLLRNVLGRNPLANIPVAGQDLGGDEKRRQAYLFKAADLYFEGYKKVC